MLIKRSTLLLLIISFSYIYSSKLPLPPSLWGKRVNYEFTEPINDLSCDYNVLFNACILESKLGRNNCYSDLEEFRKFCASYIAKGNECPVRNSEAITYVHSGNKYPTQNNQLIHLLMLTELLNLENFTYIFNFDCINKIDESLVREFNNANELYIHHFAHFGLKLIGRTLLERGDSHLVLISIVNNGAGEKSIYVSDNLNRKITENCLTLQYINAICTKFKILNSEKLISLL